MNEFDTKSTIRLALLGDVALNGYWVNPQNQPFASEIVEWLAEHNIVLLNLESSCRGDGNTLVGPIVKLATTAKAIEKLKVIHPTVCVLANNHIFDQLDAGFQNTQKAIANIPSMSVGAGWDENQAKEPNRFEIKTIPFSLLAYVDSCVCPIPTSDINIRVNYLEKERILTEVAKEHSAGRFIIVSLHWGVELSDCPTPEQRIFAKTLAEAGADLIWGHHPHTIQGWEWFDKTLVLYSMGNTCFDEDLNKGLAWESKNLQSLVVSCEISNGKLIRENTEIRIITRLNAKAIASWKTDNNLISRLLKPLSKSCDNYSSWYSMYKINLLIERGFRFFFGRGRNPLKQLIVLPNRIVRILIRRQEAKEISNV
jgi:poly-gamma-glutamate synthesis protein (capsule biosynthesis protein)